MLLLALAMTPACAAALPASAQAPGDPVPAPAPVDTMGLADGPGASMEMLYERTIFNVDVLRLRLTFGPATAGRLKALAHGIPYGETLADSVARIALSARDALVHSRFQRDVTLDQFLGGLRDNVRRAREAGLLTPEQEGAILSDTSREYERFRDRGFRTNETMWYRIRGDSVHVVVQGVDGEVLLEDRAVGPERRMAVLGGYLAPDSDFRDGLVRSLFRRIE